MNHLTQKKDWYIPGNDPQNNIFDIMLTNQDFKTRTIRQLNNNAQKKLQINNHKETIIVTQNISNDQKIIKSNNGFSTNFNSNKNELEDNHYPEITYEEYLQGNFTIKPIFVAGENYNQYIPKVRINNDECYFLAKSIKRSKKITKNYKENILKWSYSFIMISRLVI